MTGSAKSAAQIVPVSREPITIGQQGGGLYALLTRADGRVFITNDVGRAVLELCDGTHSAASIVNALAATFDGTPHAQIERDVHEFLTLACGKGVLQWSK